MWPASSGPTTITRPRSGRGGKPAGETDPKEGTTVPEIKVVVSADDSVMLRERVNPDHFESEPFRAQLAERLAWAVGDAHAIEQSRANAVKRFRATALQEVAQAAERLPRASPQTRAPPRPLVRARA